MVFIIVRRRARFTRPSLQPIQNDTGSARDGGSLGWVSPGVMVPEFEQVMKETPVGQISKPFQRQFGWHILQVTDTRQQDMTQEVQKVCEIVNFR